MLSFESAIALTQKSDCFRYKVEKINNKYTFHIFSYGLADASTFVKYSKDGSTEMRGLTFLDNGKYTLMFPGIEKFFNLNESSITQYKDLKNLKIDYVHEKLDGSLIMPIPVNGQDILCKTIKTFSSPQAIAATKYIKKNPDLEIFIQRMYSQGCMPYFEYVAPTNQIVLYSEKEFLRLIFIRDLATGSKINPLKMIGNHEIDICKPPESIDKTLDELIEDAKTIEDTEGWVITFENGLQIKIKTSWYTQLHSLLTNEITHESVIIRHVLEGKFDDFVSQIRLDDPRRTYAGEVAHCIQQYVQMVTNTLKKTYIRTYTLKRKQIVLMYKDYPYFNLLMNLITFKENDVKFEMDDIENLVKLHFLKKTHKLEQARKFLTDIGFESISSNVS